MTQNVPKQQTPLDARQSGRVTALPDEHADIVLAKSALQGLEDLAAGRVLTEGDMDRTLSPGLDPMPRG